VFRVFVSASREGNPVLGRDPGGREHWTGRAPGWATGWVRPGRTLRALWRASPRARKAGAGPVGWRYASAEGLCGPESARRVRGSGAARRRREGRTLRALGTEDRRGAPAVRPGGPRGPGGWTPGEARGAWGSRREMWRGRAAAGRPGGGSALVSESFYCLSDLGMARRSLFLAFYSWGSHPDPIKSGSNWV
jgi:hypothetical protein